MEVMKTHEVVIKMAFKVFQKRIFPIFSTNRWQNLKFFETLSEICSTKWEDF